MSRRHIHFARREPPNLPPLDANTQPTRDADDAEVVSGMRRDASVLVWVDVKGSMEAGIQWWQSENGVILTSGVNGLFPLRWVVWAERRGIGEVLYGDKARGLRMREAQSKVQKRGLRDAQEGQEEGAGSSGRQADSKDVFRKVVDAQVKQSGGESVSTATNSYQAISNGVGKLQIKENWDD